MAALILVVEDDLPLQALYREVLGKFGYRVEVAATATQASDFVRRPEPIAAVVVDLHLPGESGGDALVAAIRGKAPVIVVTGSADDDLERRLKAEGAFALLRKPFGMATLVEIVRAAVDSQPP